MRTNRTSAALAALIAAALLSGCHHAAPTTAAPKPKPSATPNAAYAAAITGPSFGMTDASGKPVADISAQSGVARTGEASNVMMGDLTKGTARLYHNGTLSATLTADKLSADSDSRTLTAHGNVRVVSADNADKMASSVRADTMRWEYDHNRISGSGNVVLTHGSLVRVPARSFVADTALKTCDLTGGAEPATGNY